VLADRPQYLDLDLDNAGALISKIPLLGVSNDRE
jgi:hypothetical protein